MFQRRRIAKSGEVMPESGVGGGELFGEGWMGEREGYARSVRETCGNVSERLGGKIYEGH